MNDDLYGLSVDNLLGVFPEALQQDEQVVALAQSVAQKLVDRQDEIGNVLIYPSIDELPEELLDILAYDFKVDWYDYDYDVAQKRQTLKDSFFVHRHLGTKAAVETAISAIYPGTTVEEWFEYGGEPYTFRLVIDATDLSVNSEQHKQVLERVDYYKNLRSHLDRVKYTVFPAPANTACAASYTGSYMRSTVNLLVPGDLGPPSVNIPAMAAVCSAGAYSRIEAAVTVNGTVDRPTRRLPVQTGVAIAGTYKKLTMEVSANGLD
jgi:phage tail P2-like protein